MVETPYPEERAAAPTRPPADPRDEGSSGVRDAAPGAGEVIETELVNGASPGEYAVTPHPEKGDGPRVERAGFQPLRPAESADFAGNYDIILDVEIDLTVELGRTNMKVRDVLALTEGSIIELEKVVGEPVDILANDRLIAYGEAVVIEDELDVRINDIVTKNTQRGEGL